MSLGVNRDYKTNARRVRKNLAAHYDLMRALIGKGCPDNLASKIAAAKVLGEKCPICQGQRTATDKACWCEGFGL